MSKKTGKKHHQRTLIGITLAILLMVSVPCHSSEEGTSALVKHPNVLFISLDDMNDWVGTLGGHEQALTPALDKFSESGVNFTRNYAPSPGCNPSRSATLTGLHTYTSGMYSNYQEWRQVPKLQSVQTIGQHVRLGATNHYG